MADVAVMREIEDSASRLGVDLSAIDLDSIHLPPDQDFGIKRYYLYHFLTKIVDKCIMGCGFSFSFFIFEIAVMMMIFTKRRI